MELPGRQILLEWFVFCQMRARLMGMELRWYVLESEKEVGGDQRQSSLASLCAEELPSTLKGNMAALSCYWELGKSKSIKCLYSTGFHWAQRNQSTQSEISEWEVGSFLKDPRVSRIYKEHLQINKMKASRPGTWIKDLNRHFTKSMSKWPEVYVRRLNLITDQGKANPLWFVHFSVCR